MRGPAWLRRFLELRAELAGDVDERERGGRAVAVAMPGEADQARRAAIFVAARLAMP